MIRHIVMFKLRSYHSADEKKNAAEIVRNELLALKKKISVISEFEVGINFNPDPEAYDLIINSTFASREDLKSYQDHPDHQAFKVFNKNYSEKKAIADYEY